MRKKKTKLQLTREKADKKFQEWFVKNNPYSEISGEPTYCGHHFFTKSSSSALRYDPDNMVAITCGEHLKFHSKNSAEMNGIIIEKRGIEWFKNLRKKKIGYIKANVSYYQEIIKKYDSN